MFRLMMAMAFATAISIGAVSAQTFTFTATTSSESQVGGVGPDGTPFWGVHSTGSSETTYADGKTAQSTFECVGMSQPPRDAIFMFHSVCTVKAEDGEFAATSGCNIIDADAGESSCVGGMYGQTGAYKGRRGTFTNHIKDGQPSTGTGQWLE